MIDTNRLDYRKDLEEVIFMFSSGEDINITHIEENDGKIFKDKFVFLNKEYNFTNEKIVKDNLELKRYEKRFSKLGLYKILSEYYGVNYEWGALTGIRPTKMAYTADDFEKELKEVFYVSDKKIAIIKDIIDTQKKILDVDGKYDDLFVSIPFCPTKCTYCSFISEALSKCKHVEKYVETLCYELDRSLSLIKNLRSVYVGGGTPISVKSEYLVSILKSIKPYLNKDTEYTVEAGRPDVITEEKLKILKDYGVNRICVNPQTFSDKTLEIIGRKHTAKSVIEKYYLAKSYDFSINMDVIAGLPEESFDDFKNTIDTVINLNPENFTVHTLCLKKGSELKNKIKRLAVGEISKMNDYAYKKAKENGYNPYYIYRQKYAADNLENIGYSKRGKECVYNIDVMEETSSNVACGANGVSKRVYPTKNLIERYGAPKDVLTYINKIEEIIKCKRELFLENK